MAILGAVTPARPLLGISEIAEEIGMSRSSTHRYVIELVNRLGPQLLATAERISVRLAHRLVIGPRDSSRAGQNGSSRQS